MSQGDRESALQAVWTALERVLVIGLTDLEPARLDAVRRCITQNGGEVEFAVRMGFHSNLVCNLVTPAPAQWEIFRIELGELEPREIQ